MPGRGRPFAAKYSTDEERRAARMRASRAFYERNREKAIAASKARYDANPKAHNAASRKSKLLREYGLTQAQYDAMVAKQGGLCAICHGPPTRGNVNLVVDHCHLTGKVRGLLCGTCNGAIGMLDDDPEIVRRAHLYLLRDDDASS